MLIFDTKGVSAIKEKENRKQKTKKYFYASVYIKQKPKLLPHILHDQFGKYHYLWCHLLR